MARLWVPFSFLQRMKITLSTVWCGAALLLAGCAAGITRTGYKPTPNQSPGGTPGRPIAIQSHAIYNSDDVVVLGSIHVYDTGFSTACDEADVLGIFLKDASALDADLIDITEEKEPDFLSSCYRARATFLHFKDREKAKSLVSDAKYASYLNMLRIRK